MKKSAELGLKSEEANYANQQARSSHQKRNLGSKTTETGTESWELGFEASARRTASHSAPAFSRSVLSPFYPVKVNQGNNDL